MPTNRTTTRKTTTRIAALTAAFLWLPILAAATARADDAPDKQTQLIVELRSDSPPAQKAIACKLLAIHGTNAAVPELARLLPNPELSSWARIALEAIPGPEADAALRSATDSLEGRLLIGTINSIGFRQDAAAVELLAARLSDKDSAVAAAAAAALGKIGNPAAASTLRPALAAGPLNVRSAVAEGCILCAERYLAAGDAAQAAAMYDEVRAADVPQQRQLEAIRGAILARKQDGIPLLLEQLQSSNKARFQIALSTAREFPGDKLDQALADALPAAPAQRAALIVQAMADRQQTVVLPAVLKAAQQGPKAVRLAALDALQRVGDATCLSALLDVAVEGDADLAAAAKSTLAEFGDQSVNSQIASLLPEAQGKLRPLLIELVGQRRIEAVARQLYKAVENEDAAVRQAALIALGETVPPDGLSVLIAQAVTPRTPADAAIAQQALKAASVRMPDREACAAELAAAFDQSATAETKSVLLETLAAVSGKQALKTIGAAARSDEPLLQDTASRLLGQWMTADAAPVLIGLAKTAPAKKYQVRALRGYIRIARQFVLPERQRAEMCRLAMAAASQPAEQKLVLEVLKRYPNPLTLEVAIAAAQKTPQLRAEATQAALAIARKLGGKGNQLQELLSRANLEQIKLEIVKAQYGAGSTQKDVTDVLRKLAGDLPLITLPSTNFNASFGGDPAPGTVKKLTIEYRINGKAGKASFAENAIILLPMPK